MRVWGFVSLVISITIGLACWVWPINISILGTSAPCGPAIYAMVMGGTAASRSSEGLDQSVYEECAGQGVTMVILGTVLGAGGLTASFILIYNGRPRRPLYSPVRQSRPVPGGPPSGRPDYTDYAGYSDYTGYSDYPGYPDYPDYAEEPAPQPQPPSSPPAPQPWPQPPAPQTFSPPVQQAPQPFAPQAATPQPFQPVPAPEEPQALRPAGPAGVSVPPEPNVVPGVPEAPGRPESPVEDPVSRAPAQAPEPSPDIATEQ